MDTYAYSPSQQWVQATDCPNSLGRLHVEILKCQDLPNLDTGIHDDYTDAFVAMAFEDNVVRTDVIHDALSPRWSKYFIVHLTLIIHVQSIHLLIFGFPSISTL